MNLQDLVFDEMRMGDGSTSTVWKAHHNDFLIPVAVKRIPRSDETSEVVKTQMIREIALHKQLDHPFIVKLFDVLETPTEFVLVQELVEHGNLLAMINKRKRLNEKVARRYFVQLVAAVEYLHSERHVVHRDIKCENILIDRFDNLRLIDFGLSRSFQHPTDTFTTQCGSPAYVAPEVFLNTSYGMSADIWSCGIVLYGMLAGYLPFYDPDPRTNLINICNANIEFPYFMSPTVVNLLSKILCKDPKSRIDIDGILHHPWFSLSDFNIIKSATMRLYSTPNSEIETGTIAQMTLDGLDCSELSYDKDEKVQNTLKVIYEVYKRSIQTKSIETVVRSFETQRSFSLPLQPHLPYLSGMKTLRTDRKQSAVRAGVPLLSMVFENCLETIPTPRPGNSCRLCRPLTPFSRKV
jgi:serine/threonine protein kinase